MATRDRFPHMVNAKSFSNKISRLKELYDDMNEIDNTGNIKKAYTASDEDHIPTLLVSLFLFLAHQEGTCPVSA